MVPQIARHSRMSYQSPFELKVIFKTIKTIFFSFGSFSKNPSRRFRGDIFLLFWNIFRYAAFRAGKHTKLPCTADRAPGS